MIRTHRHITCFWHIPSKNLTQNLIYSITPKKLRDFENGLSGTILKRTKEIHSTKSNSPWKQSQLIRQINYFKFKFIDFWRQKWKISILQFLVYTYNYQSEGTLNYWCYLSFNSWEALHFRSERSFKHYCVCLKSKTFRDCVSLKSKTLRNCLSSSSFLHHFSGITGKYNGQKYFTDIFRQLIQ